VKIRFLLGPAGSGKTFRCLAEIREALRASAEGPPLLLLAPKQATFQLERQLLADPSLPGYTRLQILSFERLAEFIVSHLADPSGELLAEEGRVMTLRALLGRHQAQLKIFHATARLPGFAQQLNLLLKEFQRAQIPPRRLAALAEKFQAQPTLAGKLHDSALLLTAYQDWLRTQKLQDANCLLDLAAGLLGETVTRGPSPLRVAGLWLDGFAEMTPQEVDLLAAFLPICDQAQLAFCLDTEARENRSWLSGWSVVNHTFEQCHARAKALPNCEVVVESLKRDPDRNRFRDAPGLQQLEKSWAGGFTIDDLRLTSQPDVSSAALIKNQKSKSENGQLDFFAAPAIKNQKRQVRLAPEIKNDCRLITCLDAEAEATFAAREILRFVRAGGRYREAAVLVRRLDDYQAIVRRVFSRYGIPFFLDRREPVAHHPLAELSRYALRLAAFGWQHDDWFGALKTGLATAADAIVDRLENEAIARGWEGAVWLKPLKIADDAALEKSVNRALGELLPPFLEWNRTLSTLEFRPGARQLTAALRELWSQLEVEKTLDAWSQSAIHSTVLDQMHAWLENVDRAFGDEVLSLAEWLPILEAGLANLSVGVIPPALDQVLVGAIDRSRNPELKLALLLGWNETIFPAPPQPRPLLTEPEREQLAEEKLWLGPGPHHQVGHERFYAYIACTRARERLVITRAAQDAEGRPLNASLFFVQLQQLTGTTEEHFNGADHWPDSEHVFELAPFVLRELCSSRREEAHSTPENARKLEPPHVGCYAEKTPLATLIDLPALAPLVRQWRELRTALSSPQLSPVTAEKLYGRELRTSVSRLEDFAACPFKFFATRGLRLQERAEFQFDDRDKGSFQHEVLCEFHRRVLASGRRWRDLKAEEAAEWIGQIGREWLPHFAGGKLQATGAARFTGEYLIARLQRLMTALIDWMPQYGFDPVAVEIGFDDDTGELPSWRLDLDDGRVLFLRGRIDRVDVCRLPDDTALAVVMDYKSRVRKLDATKLYHGLELQLLSYLGVLKHLRSPGKAFDVSQLQPAGVFFIPLNGGKPGTERPQAGTTDADERRAGYQHSGRFLGDELQRFDNRGQVEGDQFKFKILKSGEGFHRNGNEALPKAEFELLREHIESHLREFGRKIFAGDISVSPFRIGQETACDYCDFRSVCRFDPWTRTYRRLNRPSRGSAEVPAQMISSAP
jgi:ATP-dependent helicase/nuclease subunit B